MERTPTDLKAIDFILCQEVLANIHDMRGDFRFNADTIVLSWQTRFPLFPDAWLIFAVDKTPAVFAVTKAPFIVYTSKFFSIFGQLKESYEKALDTGLSLPEGCGGFSKSNRLHVRAYRGYQFQFILNQQKVRAQLFLIRTAESHYSGLVKKMRPKAHGLLHDFGHGITGNGPKPYQLIPHLPA
jgi:hypothetical protein